MESGIVNLDDVKWSGVQERILGLLGAGISAAQVAEACGVTEGYVSQCLSNEAFAASVSKLKVERAGKFVEHDEGIEAAEDAALKKLKQLIPMVVKPLEAARIFQTLNSAKRKTDPTGGLNAPTGGVVVNLELPEAAAVHFKLTVDKQVIEVEGRSMVPMPAAQVSKMLKEKQTKELLEHSLKKPAEKLAIPLLDQI